jgi:hypothetical protein
MGGKVIDSLPLTVSLRLAVLLHLGQNNIYQLPLNHPFLLHLYVQTRELFAK